MYILGISAFYHDSAACLLKDDEIIGSAQEERFTRLKNDASFPEKAIIYCLSEANIELHQVDYVVFYEKPFLKFERLLETYMAFVPKGIFSFWKSMPVWIKDKIFQKKHIISNLQSIDPLWTSTGNNLLFTEHHQSHAASAYYPSPFNEALILTIDGVGEWTTTSIAHGKENRIENIKEIKFPHSIGLLYSAFTYFLGFKVNSDEYKVMGLAPYGEPVFENAIYEHIIDIKDDGSFRLNMDYFDYCTGLKMTNKKFEKLFGNIRRHPDEELTAFHMNMACSVQKVTETVVLKILNHLSSTYDIANICLAGGVALNCVINGKILQNTKFKNIWIQPAAGDAGGALGAAFSIYYDYLNNSRKITLPDKMKGAFLGPSYDLEYIKNTLTENNLQYIEYSEQAFNETLALEISKGKVIGFFKGRMEFGPRALGARSIIGDARNPEMQSIMNLKIKYRESFRPFAPVVMQEYCNQYFNIENASPYMQLVAQVQPCHRISLTDTESKFKGMDLLKLKRSDIPAVTHVDYSARIQTVNESDNPQLYAVLNAFYKLTGCPVIINTSFNVKDEPIVCTPIDAIRCFLKSEMDILAIENVIVYK